MSEKSFRILNTKIIFAVAALVMSFGARSATAQTQSPSEALIASTSAVNSYPTSLPNAPSVAQANQAGQRYGQVRTVDFRFLQAPRYAEVIEPEYNAAPLRGGQKAVYAGHEIFSLQFPVGVLVSAGLSQGLDTDPNYGTGSTAFAKKVGAAGARGASQILFSDGLLAPILREDPRYYVLGPAHSLSGRFLYAATRVFVTRNDQGHSTVNLSILAGYGGSAALTQLYYPVHSRDAGTMLGAYGGSLVGLAIENELEEFFRFLTRNQPRR